MGIRRPLIIFIFLGEEIGECTNGLKFLTMLATNKSMRDPKINMNTETHVCMIFKESFSQESFP